MSLFTKRETAIFPRSRRRALAPMTALFLGFGLLSACKVDPLDPAEGEGGNGGGGSAEIKPAVSSYVTTAIPAAFVGYFDPPVGASYSDDYAVVGSTKPPSWSWGKIELLEGHQAYRTEGYNLRTEKERWQDTYQDTDYPLQTYYGSLNQQLVDGFNLYYKSPCAGSNGTTGAPACAATKSPMRPEARFVLLQIGPKTATLSCDTTKTPVLLVHGSIQNGNVWIQPNGNDGSGNTYPDTPHQTGFVQALETAGTCTYAVTFGTFHGDNFNQAINLANAVRRIKTLTGRPKVDVIAWSKGTIAADVYLADAAKWTDWGTKHFEALAAEQAKRVPAFQNDVRAYIALSGPHLGIDLNFRHPYDNLVIASAKENAPVGQGPLAWSSFSAIQCVTWGFLGSPQSIYPNPYADSICANRGAVWPDFWSKIYTSNITGLDSTGKPLHPKSLKTLNTAQGLAAADYNFDKYNMSMWGAFDDNGTYVSPYQGQLQVANDLRSYYPTPDRQTGQIGVNWSTIDTDESKWRQWLVIKLAYNVAPIVGGAMLDNTAHTTCRNTAYDPVAFPCKANHAYYNASTADSYLFGYATYRLMDGIGIKAAMEMGGNFIARLKSHGLNPALDYLYVLHGSAVGTGGTPFEMDGMATPTSAPHGDGVLFDVSIAAQTQLTQGWTAAQKTAKSAQEAMAYGHLDMGVTQAVWTKMINKLASVP